MANATWNIYNFRLNILRKLRDEDYRIYVIAPVDKYIIYQEEFPELNHIPLLKLKRKSTNPLADFQLAFELFSIYKKINPDLILHYTIKPNIYGGIAAGLLNIPSIAVVTGLGYAFIRKGFIRRVTKLLYRMSSRFHKKVVFENSDDLKLFMDLKLIKAKQGFMVNGCGIDTTRYSPKEKEEKETIVFTFIGRLIYDKGIKEFVEAARKLKTSNRKVSFWIIGEIDINNPAAIKENELKEWIREKIVVYHGYQDDIRSFIAESDCIVLPSYREGLSKVLLESMSMAKPLITSDVPGCRQLVDHGVNGFLAAPQDVDSLLRMINKVIDLTPIERKRMGINGRKKAVKEFDDALITEQLSTLIAQSID